MKINGKILKLIDLWSMWFKFGQKGMKSYIKINICDDIKYAYEYGKLNEKLDFPTMIYT